MEVEQTRQKTYYNYHAYGPRYREGQHVFVFFSSVKKERNKKFTFLHEGYTQLLNLLCISCCDTCCVEQREVEEKSSDEEVDDDSIETEVEQTNGQERDLQRKKVSE